MSKKPIQSDLKRIDAMSDTDIDYSDIPELDDDFFQNHRGGYAARKKVNFSSVPTKYSVLIDMLDNSSIPPVTFRA